MAEIDNTTSISRLNCELRKMHLFLSNNTAETTTVKKRRTIDMSKIQLVRDPPAKPLDNGKQPIQSINQNPSKEMEHMNTTSENTSTEVVWLPTASQKDDKALALENENIEMLHSENESDEDQSSVSDQSDHENASLDSTGDIQHRYDSDVNKITKNNKNALPYKARSDKLNPSDRKRTNPKDILQQLKVINSSKNTKPGAYISVSRREYCQEWLKHQALSGFDQDQKLFNFLASKLKPSRVLESREYLKCLVSSHSHQLSHFWIMSGKNEDKLYKVYSGWLDGAPIKLTTSKPSTVPTSNIRNKLVRIDITTNADAFKFLKNSVPPFEADGLIKLIPCTNLTVEQIAKLNDFCTRYGADMKFKFLTSNNDEGVFFTKFEWWLKLNIKWPVFLKDVLRIPKKAGPDTVENEDIDIPSNFSEEQVMKMILNSKLETVERILASKCSNTGKEISKIIHMVIHHPDEAAFIAGVMSDHRECSCYPQLAGKKIPQKDTLKPPSHVQKELVKMTIERLKDSMPKRKDSLNVDDTESPRHKKQAVSTEAHRTMMNQIVSRLKVTYPPVPNPSSIKKVNRAEIIRTDNTIVIDDDNDEIETNQAKGGDKNVEFTPHSKILSKWKVISPAKTNKELNPPIVCRNSFISTAEEGLHNSKEMIVDTPINNDNTIDSDIETPTEQTNKKNHKDLEFGPVLDKLIFIQPINLKNGTIIRLPKDKEVVVCKVSNCLATVLVPKFIKKSGPNVRVRKSKYKIEQLIKRATIDKRITASSKTSTAK